MWVWVFQNSLHCGQPLCMPLAITRLPPSSSAPLLEEGSSFEIQISCPLLWRALPENPRDTGFLFPSCAMLGKLINLSVFYLENGHDNNTNFIRLLGGLSGFMDRLIETGRDFLEAVPDLPLNQACHKTSVHEMFAHLRKWGRLSQWSCNSSGVWPS